MSIKSVAVWLLVIAALFLFQPALAEESSIPADYELVADNARLALYLRRDIMAIIIECKENGALLYSAVQNVAEHKDNATWKGFYQSGIVMEYLEGSKSNPIQADLLNKANTIEYTFLDDGFTAWVTYTDLGISYEVTVTLDESGLHVHIPQEKFVEELSDTYKLATFYVFPFLGNSCMGEHEGYMIIPDGQGAIIDLRDNEKRYNSPYYEPVYGENIGASVTTFTNWYMPPEEILMPIYGMVHTDDQIAFLGVIEEGDSSAYIKANPNGVVTKFDWISAQFVYRQRYDQPTVNSQGQSPAVVKVLPRQRAFDVRLHFLVASGEEASYAGLACMYRDYLENHGAFEQAVADKAFDMELDFIGMEKENDLFGKREILMTTFTQAREIIDDMLSSGAENLTLIYRGWYSGGMTSGLPVADYAPDRSLGGKADMQELLAYCTENGLMLMAEADFLTLNLDENPTMRYQVFKKITNIMYEEPTYKQVYGKMHLLTPASSLQLARKVAHALKENGWDSVALTGITHLVSDYQESDAYHDSTDLMAVYRQICSDNDLHTYLSGAYAYLWPEAAALYDVPVNTSGYLYTTRAIPFLSIALSGKMNCYAEYTNFQANTQRFFLQLIEQGLFPSFLLSWEDPIALINSNSNEFYSTQYELYRTMIQSWYQELNDVFQSFAGASIITHRYEGDMVCVGYDNGVHIYLNYGYEPGEMDGHALDGLDYKVVK